MSSKRTSTELGSAAGLGFLAGMVAMAALVALFRTGAGWVASGEQPPAAAPAAPGVVDVRPTPAEEPAPVAPPPPAQAAPAPIVAGNDVETLRGRRLTLPVRGIERADLQDTFDDPRGASRRHEALDVLAPRNTPVLAVEDGRIARLFLSDAGGITIYQFDPSGTFCYYYAHLERYADGLKEGAAVRRGDVIGYVGTTGNAPRDTPHLHFAIFKLTEERRWWQGTAINPYPVLM